MKRYVLTTMFVFFIVTNASASTMKSGFLWDIRDASLQRVHDDSLSLSLVLNVIEDAVASKCAVVLQPWIGVGGKRYDTAPVSFYRLDNRGLRYQVCSDNGPASGRRDETERICGMGKGFVGLKGVTPGFCKGDSVEVFVDVVECRAKDKRTVIETRKVAVFQPKPFPDFYPDYPVCYSDSTGAYTRTVTFPLNVEFEKGKNTFNVKYAMNEGMIYQLRESLRPFINNKGIVIRSISIDGYSDIRGAASDNKAMCLARITGIYNYLKKENVFGKRKVTLNAVGEDWGYLLGWFKDTYWTNDYYLNEVMFNTSIPKDIKEQRISGNDVFWGYLEESVFPSMNRYACSVTYDIIPLKSDNERWNALGVSPDFLSPFDFSSLIKGENTWTARWYDLVYAFASQYPLCREAVVNAVAADLSRGLVNEAGKRFRDMYSDEYTDYYKSVWLMYMGAWQESYLQSRKLRNPIFENTKIQIENIYEWNTSDRPWTTLKSSLKRYPNP